MMQKEIDDSDLMCDGCANQESIAAPGETTKCREHQEKSDDGIDRWFDERATLFTFHPFGNWCSRCMVNEAYYIGVTDCGTPFQFCKSCRDDLVWRADAAKQSPERFGV